MNISYSFQELSSVFASISAHVFFGLVKHGLHIFPAYAYLFNAACHWPRRN
jgi:hypothetical protein